MLFNEDPFKAALIWVAVISAIGGWLLFGVVLPWLWSSLRPLIHAATGG